MSRESERSGHLDVPVSVLARRYRSGECDPVQVVSESHARLAGIGADLGAVTEVLDRDLAEARRLTEELAAGHDRGPLHGVPVAVKELIDIGGRRRTAGTHVRPPGWDEPVDEDSWVVDSLRAAGAIIVARGRTHEFAWGITSRHPDGTGVANPRDPSRIAGGSSGGVAALVATGCASIGIGTDTGGSVRIPASFCGLVGWKPAVGRLSTRGVVPLAPTFDHVGVLTRWVPDAVLIDQVLDGGLSRPPAGLGAAGAECRVAAVEDETLPPVSPAVLEALTAASRRAGVTTVAQAGSGPDGLPPAADLVAAFGLVQRSEALAVHRDLLGTWPGQAEAYGDDVAGRLREAEDLDPAAVIEARVDRRQAQAAYHRAFAAAEIDAVVLPGVACGPSTIIDPDTVVLDGHSMPLRDAVMPFTIPANMTGWPALVVPVEGFGADSQASVQIVARPGCEYLLPGLAALLSPAPTSPEQ